MSPAIQAELDLVVSQLVERRWAVRAAVVSSSGEVLTLCTGSRGELGHLADVTLGRTVAEHAIVGRLAVENLDSERWLYVDLGSVRVMARLSREARADTVVNWLAAELRRMGVTLERESLAQD